MAGQTGQAGYAHPELLAETVAEVGESIQISRFARFRVGESTASNAGND